MKTTFDGTYCTASEDASVLYEQNGYGRQERDGRLRLEPCEALYLEARGKIELEGYTFNTLLAACTKDPSFLRNFIVYRDIRERGYVITVGHADKNQTAAKNTAFFRIFPRGQRPGKGNSRYLLRVLSERDLIDFSVLIRDAKTAANMRKQLVLAVLDDEHELTYYEVRLPVLTARKAQEIAPGICAHLTGIPAFVEGDRVEELQKNWFGTMMDLSRLYLSPLETAWLLREGPLTLDAGLTADEYEALGKESDTEFALKLKLFTYFKSLGYYPRSGYKYGHHFRVYTEEDNHSEMLAHAVSDSTVASMQEISRSVRLAHSVKKRILFVSITDNEIIPIEFARIKM
ncbi:MAG TPA: tRNA-intron lyase [Methanocorpusculum sp.]|nr:tRNA-intron lyase [Methanocorpusculum sp.]